MATERGRRNWCRKVMPTCVSWGVSIFRLIGTCVTGAGCALPVGISVEKGDPTGVSWQVSIFPFVRVYSNCAPFDVF